MIILFDLDDTLYDEKTFVLSGFAAVSKHLAHYYELDSQKLCKEFQKALQISRDEVFDRVLKRYGFGATVVKKCVAIYRSHRPKITLFSYAKKCLQRLQKYPLYVVTDGNIRVQKSKYAALGLDKYTRKCVCTWQYGKNHTKPSPYAFEKICQWEKAAPNTVVYIGDNPNKDFIGIKPLGFHTIRVRTGSYRDLYIDQDHEAELVVSSVGSITEKALKRLVEKV